MNSNNLSNKQKGLAYSESPDRTGNPALLIAVMFLVLVIGWGTIPVHAEDNHSESTDVLGFNFHEGWFEPFVHSHFSPHDTPLIHSFRAEPAFTQRDFIFDYGFRSETESTEHEIEAELEWALTRRFGVIIETPYVFLDNDHEEDAEGCSNLAVSPRLLLVELERFFLAFALETEIPTGTTAGDISEEHTALAPSLSAWLDLGNWWTLHAQTGIEQALEGNDAELFCRSALIYTFASEDVRGPGKARQHHDHLQYTALPPGLFSLIFEADLAVGLSGEPDGEWMAEGILGLSLGLWDEADLRAGYQFPLSKSQELNSGLTCGLIYHF